MKVSWIALAISLAVGGAGGGAAAQQYGSQQAQQQPPQTPQPSERSSRRRGQQQEQQQAATPQIPREELALIQPVNQAVQAQNWEAAAAALPAAQAGVQTPYGKFVVAQLQLSIGRGTNNLPMQTQAVDAMLASGGAPEANLPAILGARISFALQANDFATAEQYLTRLTSTGTPSAERLRQLAEVKIRLNKNDEALALYQRLIDSGAEAATEENIKRTLEIATVLRRRDVSLGLMQRLLQAYPTAANWQSVLPTFRQMMGDETGIALDVRRLMRTAQAFNGPEDYLEFAGRLTRAGQPGEVKAVLEEGMSRGIVPAGDATARQMLTTANGRIAEDQATLPALRTRALAASNGREARIAGDTYYGYGQFAQAAELYRAALQKGGEDANLVNTRLGAALVAANQPAEAQAAFRAVSGGDRAALARLWLLWLERRQG